MPTTEEMRQYIRHPSDIPIEYSISDRASEEKPRICNISRSGLSFISSNKIEPDSIIHIKILLEGYDFSVESIVMWCHDRDDKYEIGVKFDNPKAEFSVRMIEQLCHIEEYRQQVAAREGRTLSSNEAASEWVKKFAGDFPS